MAVVILPFPYAGDGFTLEHLKPGDERDFGDCLSGLVAEGLVADNPAETAALNGGQSVLPSAEPAAHPHDAVTATAPAPTPTVAVEPAPAAKRKRK